RLGLRLLLQLPDAARELVADELLRARQDLVLRLVDRHPGEPLELANLALLRGLQLLLERLRVHLALGDPLLAARELALPAPKLGLLGREPLVKPLSLGLTVLQLPLQLLAQTDGFLLRLELRLAAQRIRLVAGLLH